MDDDDGRQSSKRQAVERVQSLSTATQDAAEIRLVAPTTNSEASEVQSRSEQPLHDLSTNALLQPATPGRSPRLVIDRPMTPGLRPTRLRHILPVIVQDCLQNGGRPESVAVVSTPLGEDIEAQCRMHKGDMKTKLVRWTVESEVPSTIPGELDILSANKCNAHLYICSGRTRLYQARVMRAPQRHQVHRRRDDLCDRQPQSQSTLRGYQCRGHRAWHSVDLPTRTLQSFLARGRFAHASQRRVGVRIARGKGSRTEDWRRCGLCPVRHDRTSAWIRV